MIDSTTIISLLLSVCIFELQFLRSFGVTCFNMTDMISCNSVSLCEWNEASEINNNKGYCGCASSVTQNIQFLMDSSASVGSINWQKEIKFVNNIIQTGISNHTNVGIISFSTNVRIDYSIISYIQNRQTMSNIATKINLYQTLNTMQFHGLTTHTNDAIETAINEFDQIPMKTNDNNIINGDKLLILITDGNPYPPDTQDPCKLKSILDKQNINLLVVGIGHLWNESTIDCLANNVSKQFVHINDFDSLHLARYMTDDFLCVVSQAPTPFPTHFPSHLPSDLPSHSPSYEPSHLPSHVPSHLPTTSSTTKPSHLPSYLPSQTPSYVPSYQPSHQPSHLPTISSTSKPSDLPSHSPSHVPSHIPSHLPTVSPTSKPVHVTTTHEPALYPSTTQEEPTEIPSTATTTDGNSGNKNNQTDKCQSCYKSCRKQVHNCMNDCYCSRLLNEARQELNVTGNNQSGIWVTSYKHYSDAKSYLCEQGLCSQIENYNLLFQLFQCGDQYSCHMSPIQKHEAYGCC